jgi:hypothetical protein
VTAAPRAFGTCSKSSVIVSKVPRICNKLLKREIAAPPSECSPESSGAGSQADPPKTLPEAARIDREERNIAPRTVTAAHVSVRMLLVRKIWCPFGVHKTLKRTPNRRIS